MAKCPDCGTVMVSRVCGACGYAPGADPGNTLLCAHEFHGQRCAKLGVVSPSSGGDLKPRFYCWQHAPLLQQFRDGKPCPPPMGFAGLRAVINRSGPVPISVDIEADVERLALQLEEPLSG